MFIVTEYAALNKDFTYLLTYLLSYYGIKLIMKL